MPNHRQERAGWGRDLAGQGRPATLLADMHKHVCTQTWGGAHVESDTTHIPEDKPLNHSAQQGSKPEFPHLILKYSGTSARRLGTVGAGPKAVCSEWDATIDAGVSLGDLAADVVR